MSSVGDWSRADGSFRIRGIAPGTYWLATNTRWVENPAPVTPALLDGGPIEIAMGSHVEGRTIVAGERLTPRKLVLHVNGETSLGGTLMVYSAASPALTHATTFGKGGDYLELLIFRELGYRLQMKFKREIDIPPGDHDVELTIN
jgi:hypothetical protein